MDTKDVKNIEAKNNSFKSELQDAKNMDLKILITNA